jgi:hypothetical protein
MVTGIASRSERDPAIPMFFVHGRMKGFPQSAELRCLRRSRKSSSDNRAITMKGVDNLRRRIPGTSMSKPLSRRSRDFFAGIPHNRENRATKSARSRKNRARRPAGNVFPFASFAFLSAKVLSSRPGLASFLALVLSGLLGSNVSIGREAERLDRFGKANGIDAVAGYES